MTVVHTESNLIQIGITIILSNCSPGMPESIITVVILLLHSHIGTYLSDSNIYVGIETVRIAVTFMEFEKIFIILVWKILVKCDLNERFHTHFNIGFIFPAMLCLSSFISDNTILIVFFFKLKNIYGVYSAHTQG